MQYLIPYPLYRRYQVGKNQLSIRLVMYQVSTCKFHLICYNVSYYSETLQKHYRNTAALHISYLHLGCL